MDIITINVKPKTQMLVHYLSQSYCAQLQQPIVIWAFVMISRLIINC